MAEKEINWGGPAYPTIENIEHNSNWRTDEGMTLRIRIAIEAMGSIISTLPYNPAMPGSEEYEYIARGAFAYADAMIAAMDTQ